ncbi:adenosine receptor A2b-like [Ptychodera flava]|uniref:adenosine receptor A2b-like n=1 Tax=Ptychodera flava TaxID=63121 RepID=UPI003969EC89
MESKNSSWTDNSSFVDKDDDAVVLDHGESQNDVLYISDELFFGINALNCVLIVTGNALVIIAVFRQPKLRKSATNHFIVSLSVADFMVGAFYIPIQVLNYYSIGLIENEILCDFMYSFSWTCPNSTVFSLLSIAVDRYRAIVTPMKGPLTLTQARVGIVATWLFTFAYTSHKIVATGMVTFPVQIGGHNVSIQTCTYRPDQRTLMMYTSITDITLGYFIPLAIIVYYYSRMIGTLCCGKSLSPDSRRRKMKAVRMLVIVVVMFAITWGQSRTLGVLVYAVPGSSTFTASRFVFTLFLIMFFSNSWMNPVIYALFSRNFRSEFTDILSCGRREAKTRPENRNADGKKTNESKGSGVDSNINTAEESIRSRNSEDQDLKPRDSILTNNTNLDSSLNTRGESFSADNEAFEMENQNSNLDSEVA